MTHKIVTNSDIRIKGIANVDSLYCSDCESKTVINAQFQTVTEISFTCINCGITNYRIITN